jgi:hypothetical protein
VSELRQVNRPGVHVLGQPGEDPLPALANELLDRNLGHADRVHVLYRSFLVQLQGQNFRDPVVDCHAVRSIGVTNCFLVV